MKTKEEIEKAIKNLKANPEKTGWGIGRKDVSDYIIALEWVLAEGFDIKGILEEAEKEAKIIRAYLKKNLIDLPD